MHVGKAAALIVIAFLLGFIVVKDGGPGASAARNVDVDTFTETTLPSLDETTTTVASERQPAQVKVIAINATGRGGVATQATTTLRNAGYNALAPGNATAAVTASRPASAVYYAPGYQREGLTIAALFSLADAAVKPLPTPSPSADIRSDTNVAVLVGTGIKLS